MLMYICGGLLRHCIVLLLAIDRRPLLLPPAVPRSPPKVEFSHMSRSTLPARHAGRLFCQAADIDPLRLRVQWDNVFPRARQQMKRGLSNKEAWKHTMERLQHRNLVQIHITDDLRKALVAYVAFGISTSGVEQKFSLAALKFNCRQTHANAHNEDMFLKIALDFPTRDLTKTILNAQRIWQECCGRLSGRHYMRRLERIDKGVKRSQSAVMMEGGEAAFIRQRRKAAGLAVAVADDSTHEVGPGLNWGATHQKELDFLNHKRNDKRFNAYSENVLLPHEVTHAVGQCAAAKRKKQLADQLARSRKIERVRRAALGTPSARLLEAIKGKPVFVDIPCRSPEVATALIALRLKSVRMHEAEVFVVKTPGRAGPFVSAASAFKGGYEVTPGLLISGRFGAGVKMLPTYHLKKIMYMSAEFRGAQGPFCMFVQNLVRHTPGCKWRLGGFNWPELKKAHAPGNLFALVSPPEVAQPAFHNHRNTFMVDSFLTRIRCVCMSSSVSGLR